MNFQPITRNNIAPWASLLAVSFERKPEDMSRLLEWFHSFGLLAWGAWDGERLAAQYSCLLRRLRVPWRETPQLVGLSVNMTVHPDYRGRGLVKEVSRPVYAALHEMGGAAGVGFSNAAGVKVDRRSKGYGYQVVGRMESRGIWLREGKTAVSTKLTTASSITLTSTYPNDISWQPNDGELIRFDADTNGVRLRFAHHPFRQYQYGLWQKNGKTIGIVVYRSMHIGRFIGASLLAAHGDDLAGMLGGWTAVMRQNGTSFIHWAATPNSTLSSAMKPLGIGFANPFPRSPYYLTVKPLSSTHAPQFEEFSRWDCNGGDIL